MIVALPLVLELTNFSESSDWSKLTASAPSVVADGYKSK
jgi:hypothetical protein